MKLISKRVGAWAAAGAVVVAGAVAASAPAQASSTFSCASNYGYLLAVDSASPYELWDYRYTGVQDTSTGSWATRVNIGTGWNVYSMIRAGANGAIYGWTPSGALRYYDWNVGLTNGYAIKAQVVKAPGANGTTADGSDTAWGSWGSTTNRNRVAVDGKNNIFTLDTTGVVRRYYYSASSNSWSAWAVPVGQLRGSYDMLWASDTALWARTTGGNLVRLRWDPATDRIETEWTGGSGWGIFKYITSVGGDVLFAVKTDGGLYKYKFDENTGVMTSAVKVGSGWSSFASLTAVGNSCTRSYPATPNVATAIAQDSPISVVSTPSKKLSLAYSDNVGFLRYGYIADTGVALNSGSVVWSNLQDGYASAGRPALYQQPTTNKVALLGHTTAGDIVSREEKTADTGTFTSWFDENGAMSGDPTAYTTSDGRAGVLTTDSSGNVWMKDQSSLNTPRDFYAWRKLPLSGLKPGAPLTATNGGSGKVVVSAVNAAGHVVASTVNVATLTTSAWTDLPVPDGALAQGTVTGTAYPGGAVRLAVSDTLGQVWTTRQDSTSFAWSSTWTRVAPNDLTKGSPSMVLSPATGLVEIVSRDLDGNVVFAQEDSQGSGTFAQFKSVVPDGGSIKYDTDPTAFTYVASNGEVWGFVGYDDNRAVTLGTAGTQTLNGVAARTSGARTASAEPVPTFTFQTIRPGDDK